MDTNQKLALARSAIYNHDNTTLATLVVENQVGDDSVVSDYVLSHENGLFVLLDKFWFAFEKEIMQLENLEVEMSDFHVEYAKQYIKYGADIIDNNSELSWRLWLCLWVVGFDKIPHLTLCLAFIMEKMSVHCNLHGEKNWIVIDELLKTNTTVDSVPIVVTQSNYYDRIRLYGVWTFQGILIGNNPLIINADKVPVTANVLAQSLQQCFVRPPDRVMQLLDLPRFQTPIGTDV